MKNNKFLVFITIILALSISIFAAISFAAEDEEEIIIEAPKAGITPDNPFYFIDEIVEEVTLKVKDGEEKAAYALEIAKEKAAEAQVMAAENNTEALVVALLKAKNASAIISQEISPDLEQQFAADQEQIKSILNNIQQQMPSNEEIQNIFDTLTNEIEKNKFALEMAKKISHLCEELALVDYDIMEQEEKCNAESAPEWLRDHIKENIQQTQEQATNKFAEVLNACILNIKECQCDEIPVQKMKRYCENEKKLIILCNFENDESACQELDSEDKYAGEELLPEFMRDEFHDIMDNAEKIMFEKYAPKECIEARANTREECETIMIEKYGERPEECLDDGKFIGEQQCLEKMAKSGKIPDQCLKDGKFIGREQCEEIMMQSGDIPEECVENNKFVGEEQCIEKMVQSGKIPDKCLDNGKFIGKEACESIMMQSNNVPQECSENGKFIGEKACEEKLKSQGLRDERGQNNAPEECMKNGEFIGMEECESIMKEKDSENNRQGSDLKYYNNNNNNKQNEIPTLQTVPEFDFFTSLQKMEQEGRITFNQPIKDLSQNEIQELLKKAEQNSNEAADFTNVERFQKEINELEQGENYNSNSEQDNQVQESEDQDYIQDENE